MGYSHEEINCEKCESPLQFVANRNNNDFFNYAYNWFNWRNFFCRKFRTKPLFFILKGLNLYYGKVMDVEPHEKQY